MYTIVALQAAKVWIGGWIGGGWVVVCSCVVHSPYGHPVLFVRKKTGNFGMSMEYSSLNQQTMKSR